MANKRNANTLYIDTAGTGLSERNMRVVGVVVSATAATAQIVLADTTTTATKLDLRVATSGETQFFDLSNCPVVFPNGINVATLTNCVATLVLTGSGG